MSHSPVAATLAWDAGIGLDGYIIYYGTAPGPTYDWNVAVGDSTSFTITGLGLGITYWFAVAGIYNGYNETSISLAVAFTGMPTAQAITLTTPPPDTAIYNSTFSVAATGGASGNPVVITTSGGCSGGGNNSASVQMTSGTTGCGIQFNQAGNATYSAAPEVVKSVGAQLASQATLILHRRQPLPTDPRPP